MNKIIRNLALLLCMAFAFSFNVMAVASPEVQNVIWRVADPPAETIDAVVTVNDNNPSHTIDDLHLSVQSENQMSHETFLEGDTQEISARWKKFAEQLYDFPVFRYGGSSAEITNLIANIGPVNQRKGSMYVDTSFNAWYYGSTSESGSGPLRMGPIEFVKMMESVNPDAMFQPCISMTVSTPQDNANLAQFLMDEPSESQWGALRAQYGHPEPVKIYAFELGNEIDNAGYIGKGWSFGQEKLDWYVPTAQAHIDAIKAVRPDAVFMACGKTAAWHEVPDWGVREDWRKWTQGVIEGIGKDCRYLAFHCYYDGHTINYMDYFMKAQIEDIENILGKDTDMEIVVTEHSRWADPNAYNVNAPMISLQSALSTAQYFNRMYSYDRLAGSQYHNFMSGGQIWSLIHDIDGELVQSVPGKMFHTYAKGIGDRYIPSTVESDSLRTDITSSQVKFTVMASAQDKRTLKLVLNNCREEEDYNLTFNFNNNYTLNEEVVFTAPNVHSYVADKGSFDIATETITPKNEKNFKTYHMPAKSLVVLTLTADKDIPQVGEGKSGGAGGEILADVETTFKDLDSCWAKNEIAVMAQNGFISGVSETVYNPNASITRAEFASIITKMMGYETNYTQTVFEDVSMDAWYAGAVNAAYFEGAMKGVANTKFAPDAPITLEEVAATVNRIYKTKNPDDLTVKPEKLSAVKDLSGISVWAENDIAFAIDKGFIYRLYENGYFAGRSNATRAQAASVLYRLYASL